MIFEGFPNISDSLALWCCDLAHIILKQTVSAMLQCDEITGTNETCFSVDDLRLLRFGEMSPLKLVLLSLHNL